ncbi:MAG: DJ-1/PfpI family protein [Candidatus Dormibacteria bacterium]
MTRSSPVTTRPNQAHPGYRKRGEFAHRRDASTPHADPGEHASLTSDRLQVAIPLFPAVAALDAVGPYEVLQCIPSVNVVFLGYRRGRVRAEGAMLGLVVDRTFEDLPYPDVIVFPGGAGVGRLEHDDRVLNWVRKAHAGTRFTTAVSAGSLVLGAAGLLRGLTATTDGRYRSELNAYGAKAETARVIEHLDKRVITASGALGAIEMAWRLVEVLYGPDAVHFDRMMLVAGSRSGWVLPARCASV